MAKRKPPPKKRRPAELVAALRLAKQGQKDLDTRIDALIAQFVKAEAEVAGKALRALASGRLGKLKFRRQEERAVKELLADLDELAKPRARKAVKESYRLGARVAQRAGATGPSLSRVNQQALDVLTDNLSGRLDSATTTVGRRVEDVYRREGLRLAAANLVDEKPIEEAARELTRRLGASGVTAFVDKAGRRWGLESYADMAIRTVTSEAVNVGTQTTMLARGYDLVEVNTIHGACDICKPYEGRTYSLTGRTEGYPELEQLPPWHGRCRHFIVPSPLAFESKVAA
jgi:hypothetical protein